MAQNDVGENRRVDRLMDSTLDSVDLAEELAMEVAGQSGFEEEDQHKVGMAVREAMVNAVVHGNRYSAHKKVQLAIVVRQDRMTIRITDEGEGFDPASLPDPLAPENLLNQSGRGILLIRAFVDEFRIERGETAGMRLELVKYLNSSGS